MATRIHLAGLTALTLLIGCSDDSAVDAKETQGLPGAQPSLGERAKELGADAKNLLVTSLERGIEQADDKLADLRQRFGPELEQASEASRAGWNNLKAGLEEARKDAAVKLAELRAASAENFQAARQSFQAAYDRLEQKIAEAKKQLDEK